jgi:hypothetical protein
MNDINQTKIYGNKNNNTLYSLNQLSDELNNEENELINKLDDNKKSINDKCDI